MFSINTKLWYLRYSPKSSKSFMKVLIMNLWIKVTHKHVVVICSEMKRVQFLPLQSFDIHVFRVRTGKNREHLKYLKNVYCVMANHRTGSRSGHANWRQNHELINVVVAVQCSHAWLAFLVQDNNIPEIFQVFMVFAVALYYCGLPDQRLK